MPPFRLRTEPNRNRWIVPRRTPPARQRIIDCDVHHSPPNNEALFPYLPRQYVEQIKDFGSMMPNVGYTNMPRGHALPDLWEGTEDEVDPSTRPEVCSTRHLDHYGIDFAVLTGAGGPYGMAVHPTVDYAAAYCRAHNDYTLEEWVGKDDRMKASIHIAPADPQQAAAEIDRLGDHPGVAQVLMPAGSLHPFGNRIYDPIYEACERNGLPMCVHFGGEGAGFSAPPHRGRLPNLLPRNAHGHAPRSPWPIPPALSAKASSKSFPISSSFSSNSTPSGYPASCGTWTPTGRACATTRPGSSAFPANTCASISASAHSPSRTRPDRKSLETFLDWLHADEILVFASDYPHWDWEEPAFFMRSLDKKLRPSVMYDTAAELYGLN